MQFFVRAGIFYVCFRELQFGRLAIQGVAHHLALTFTCPDAAEAFLRRMEMERALIWQIGFNLVVGRETVVAEKASSTCPMHSEHLLYALNMYGIEPPPLHDICVAFQDLAIGFVVVDGGYGAGQISGGCFTPAVAWDIDLSSWSVGFYWCLPYIVFAFVGAAIAAIQVAREALADEVAARRQEISLAVKGFDDLREGLAEVSVARERGGARLTEQTSALDAALRDECLTREAAERKALTERAELQDGVQRLDRLHVVEWSNR